MKSSLGPLRWRLTAWYVGIFSLIFVMFGAALLWVLTHQVSLRLDRSLESAAAEVVRAAEIRETERTLPPGSAVDAFEELRIPGRMLYVFDGRARLVHPSHAPTWLYAAVRGALQDGETWARAEAGGDRTYRVYARRFELSGARPFVAVASADVVELEQEYASLILVFCLAGAGSLILVAFGGAAMARRSTEPIEHAFRQMRRFMADAAHELRTPLTVLRGRADVALQRARTTDEYAAVLAGVAAETGRMSAMVEKMLLLSQADSGELRLHREDVFLDDLLVEAAEDAFAIAAGRDVTVEISALEEAAVHADRHLARQLLFNILANAVQFSPDGERVLVSLTHRAGTAEVAIRDHGPGIAPAALPHVFEPFFRGDAARPRTGGAGLGLAIAHSIAVAHDATIDIQPDRDRGTCVRIRFPTVSTAGDGGPTDSGHHA